MKRNHRVGFRLTRAERLRVSRLRRKDETIHQTARRLLLLGTLPSDMDAQTAPATLRDRCYAVAGEASFFDNDSAAPGLFINTNDWFAWGCADAEPVTEDSFPMLAAACRDAGKEWGPQLYASRVHGMRPQGAWFECIPETLHHLFLAVGPRRDVGLGNPRPAPDDT